MKDNLQPVGVIHCPVVGQCVITLQRFKAGETVFQFDGPVIPFQTQWSMQLAPDRYVNDVEVMGKVAHSCNPNAICDVAAREVVAIKDIAEGARVTIDYERTEDNLFAVFNCGCKSSNCRGLITGRQK